MCAVEFNYKTYFTEEQWASLPNDVKEKCKTEPIFASVVKNQLSTGAKPSDISTQLANPGGKVAEPSMKGLQLRRHQQTLLQIQELELLQLRLKIMRL